jgi:hypothetical protein
MTSFSMSVQCVTSSVTREHVHRCEFSYDTHTHIIHISLSALITFNIEQVVPTISDKNYVIVTCILDMPCNKLLCKHIAGRKKIES